MARAFILSVAGVLASCAPASAPVPPKPAATGLRCVALADVQRAEIVRDDQMLFHLRDGSHLQMHFPRACPGLAAAGQFTFAPEKSQLCAGDPVRVVQQSPVPSLGADCDLGYFWPPNTSPGPVPPQIGAGKPG